MQKDSFILRSACGIAASAVLVFSASANEGDERRFGFSGPEIFPIDNQIGQLRAADINGDGLLDLIIVNNFRSKINLLINQTGQTNAAAAPRGKRELNELPPDARFRIESVASEKRISSLAVGDLNGDGRPDLAYYGEPRELVVQYNLGTNGWSAPKRWPIEDGQLHLNSLVEGDLNNDGRNDLVLLGENHLYVFYQSENRLLGEPEKLPYSGVVKAAQILDIDGDRRNDLLLINWDSPNPFRFRLQNASGTLGPEIHFSLPAIRSYWADDLDGDGKAEVMTIAMQSGRAQLSHFTQNDAEPLLGSLRQGQFQVLPLQKTEKARRGAVWADVNGDGLSDFLVAEPGSGQLAVYLQQAGGELGSPQTFPSLTGISDLAVADWAKAGRPDIFLLSTDERIVGVTRLDANGRISFPAMVPLDGRPLILATGSLKPKAAPSLAVIVDKDGRRELMIRSADGATRTQKLSESFRSNPTTLAFHDINQDGLTDLVVLIPYEKIKVLLQQEGGEFEEIDIAPPGGSVEQPWMTSLDVDGDNKPELLLAQRNFLRAVVLQNEADKKESDGRPMRSFLVKDQINGAASNSRIVGAAALPQGNGEGAALFLLDAERKILSVCHRDKTGVWQIARNLPLPVTQFSSLQPISMGSKKPNSIAFLGLNEAAWMGFSGKVWEFTERDGYETTIRDGYLMDVVSGDLNADGKKDLVFLESAKNHIDIVKFIPPHQLEPANRWQVFEERTFRSRRSDSPEPREALIADLTGDGKNDLIVVVHDRILVYPQQ